MEESNINNEAVIITIPESLSDSVIGTNQTASSVTIKKKQKNKQKSRQMPPNRRNGLTVFLIFALMLIFFMAYLIMEMSNRQGDAIHTAAGKLKVFLITASTTVGVVIGICLLVKFYVEAGGYLGQYKKSLLTKVLKKQRIEYAGETVSRKETVGIFFKALLFRLLVFAVSVLAIFSAGGEAHGMTLTRILDYGNIWDASHYMGIAQYGYSSYLTDGVPLAIVFYPLYPMLLRVFHLVISDYRLCGVLISFLTYAVGCCYFYKLIVRDFNREIAKTAVVLISVFPFAFFFGYTFTESLFFMVSAMCLYYIRGHKWWMVGLVGIAGTLTRTQGLLLVVPAMVEICVAYKPLKLLRKHKFKRFFQEVVGNALKCCLLFIGTGIYLFINQVVTGNPLQFFVYLREHWSQTLCSFPDTLDYLLYYVQASFSEVTSINMWGPTIVICILCIIIAGYGMLKHKSTYMIYLFVYCLLTFSASWLLSGCRYTLNALPLYIIVAEFLFRHKKYRTGVITISTMLFTVFMINFLFGRSIM